MFGVLVNTLAVLIGGGLGLWLRNGIPEKISGAVMGAVGLSTLYLGITATLQGQDAIGAILALMIGAAIGTALDLDGKITALGKRAEKRLSKGGGNAAQGFVAASLLFCVGSMAIVGSLNAGLKGDHSMLLAKSALDLISSAMLAATLGAGVLLAAGTVLVYQGAIVLLAGLLSPALSPLAVAQMGCVGGIIILALGLNLLKITEIKVADLLPAILLAPFISLLTGLL